MNKLGGYLRLMRPINCLMMGFAVIAGAALANPQTMYLNWQNLVYGFITGFALTAASMVVNDYYDREIDAVNEPNRPIPSGLIKPKEALAFAFALTVIGFAAAGANSFLTSVFCLLTAATSWIISIAYTTFGKHTGLLGNFLVSACVTVPFIYGNIAIVNEVKLNVLVFVAIVFLSATGREITKGIVDVQGDRIRNVKTLAVCYGERTAAIAAVLFYLSAISLSPLPWLLKFVSFWFIPFVALTDLGLAASSLMLLKNYSKENARKVKNHVLIWFIFGLIAFLLGALLN